MNRRESILATLAALLTGLWGKLWHGQGLEDYQSLENYPTYKDWESTANDGQWHYTATVHTFIDGEFVETARWIDGERVDGEVSDGQ